MPSREGALVAGASKASRDRSALDDFVVAGAAAGSSQGQNESGDALPVVLVQQTGASGRGHRRWSETLLVLLPLCLWSKHSGWCCSREIHGFAKGCTILSFVRGPQQAGGDPVPAAATPLARAEGWADALNYRSSNFPGRIRSWRFSGMTVLCSPSWPPV